MKKLFSVLLLFAVITTARSHTINDTTQLRALINTWIVPNSAITATKLNKLLTSTVGFLKPGSVDSLRKSNDSIYIIRNGVSTFVFMATGAGGGTTETASNGLTKVGNDIQLGGTLLSGRTINLLNKDMVFMTTTGGRFFVSPNNTIPFGNPGYRWAQVEANENYIGLSSTGRNASSQYGSSQVVLEPDSLEIRSVDNFTAQSTAIKLGKDSMTLASSGKIKLIAPGIDKDWGAGTRALGTDQLGRVVTIASGSGGSGITSITAGYGTTGGTITTTGTIAADTAVLESQARAVNRAALNVTLTGTQTITGNKTFSGDIVVPNQTYPALTNKAVNSNYVDGALAAALALKVNIAPAIQNITSGSSAIMPDSVTWVIVNPATVLTSMSITFPVMPTNGKEIVFSFGGTITSTAESVVNTFTVVPNTGQGIIGQTVFYSVETDNHFTFKYNSSLSKWYRL